MAITANFRLDEVDEQVDFEHIALGTGNATHQILMDGLENGVDPVLAQRLKDAFDEHTAAVRQKSEAVLTHGIASAEIIHAADQASSAYFRLKSELGDRPEFLYLQNPIHRKKFDASPYAVQKEGKIALPNPYPGATAAMDGIWPGYDKPEHFDEYPFLRRYESRYPGKALQMFLREHRIFFHFPETISRYGVLFVPPPYLDDDLNVELRRHLSQCDPLMHTTPRLSEDTTVEEASLVLSYVEDDMVATVEDDGGTVLGVVGWQDLVGKKPGTLVRDFYRHDFNAAPSGFDSRAQDAAKTAFDYMESKGHAGDGRPEWNYMLQMPTEKGQPPRIVTKTTAAICNFLPPHRYKDGLGSALYLGISDIAEGNRLINRLETEADGVPLAFVETAHADTQFYRKILHHYRKRLQDVFIMAGTTVDPDAVLDFILEYGADGVKLGIAEGTACRTSRTGVALPNAHVGLECGAIAAELAVLLLDGWGEADEFIKGLAMTGIQMRQGGGAFVGRRESANPWLNRNGGRGKFYRGMAGADVQEAVLGRKASDIEKRMEAGAHLHSEGVEIFVKQRSPSTVGRMLLAHMFLLKSAMSYQGVRSEIQEKALRQFHRLAKLYRIPQRASN